MSGAFQYRPKFVDIRVRPPRPEEEKADVHELRPGQRACDWPDCRRPADSRAPKSRDLPDEHYWFCQAHAGEYNRNWNFFAGMSEDQIRARVEEETSTGGRPTWQFKASKFSREAAAFSAKAGTGQGYADPFNVFGFKSPPPTAPQAPQRRLGKLERQAFADLDLPETADAAAIRARYAELVKRCHPDANGGDRSAEHRLQRVIKSYKTLKKAKLA
jgi:DnaJ-domain-containing protein 1